MSSFGIVEVDNDGFKYLNTAGTETNLGTETTLLTLATETTLQALDAKLATIDAVLDSILVDTGQIEALLTTIDADTSVLAAVDYATQATLVSIKDTAGIKKITDALPAGANEIGAVAQGTPGASADAWPVALVSDGGGVIQSDAFNRLYTATPSALLDYYSTYGIDPNEVDSDVVTGGTVAENLGQSAIDIRATATSGSAARLVSKKFLRYQAGRGQDIILSGYHTDVGQTNQDRLWGYFTPDATTPEGLFFRLSGTALSIERKSNVSGVADDFKAQADWNVDPLNGSGPSGITLDITKGTIYEISFQWLGVGVVTFRVNGILVHIMAHPNLFAGPYMRSPIHPVAVEVINTGASAIGGMTIICMSGTSQGGEEAPKFTSAAQNSSAISVSTTEKAVLAIRPKALFNTVANRILMLPTAIEIEHTSGQLRWRLVVGATMTGGSWVSAKPNSGGEFNATMTAFTGGDLLTGGFISTAPGSVRINLEPFFDRLGFSLKNPLYAAQEEMALICIKDSGGTTDVRSTITWGEIR